MKMRLISLIIVFSLVVSLIPSVYAGAEAEYSSKDTNYLGGFTVTERNGAEVHSFLAQRGIPFKDGILKKDDDIYIINCTTGEKTKFQTKVLESYKDGYTSWLLVSVVCDLSPYESIRYEIYKGKDNMSGEALAASDGSGFVNVDNGNFVALFDGMGLRNLKKESVWLLDDEGASAVYVEKGINYSLENTKLEIIDNGPIYAKIKFTASYGEGAIRIEKTYTISLGSDSFECTTLYVSHNGTYRHSRNWGYDTVNSMYDTFSLINGFTDVSYAPGTHSADDGIKSVDYVTVYNPYDDVSLSVISKDVAKFRSALTREECNGFLFEGGKLIYTPLIYNSSYDWQDGASKSTHCRIMVTKGNNAECEAVYKTICDTPSVNPDASMFVETGIISSDKVSAVARAQIEEIKWTKNRRYGKFDAGAIPFYVNSTENYMGADNSVRLGEVEYNVWLAAIASGDGELFDIVNESTEAWADIEIYQGTVKEARGYTRYRSGSTSDSTVSHGYYGECSSLYIAYLMTGNDYFKEQLYSVADLQARYAAVAANPNGHQMYNFGGWADSRMGINGDYKTFETRYAFMMRAIYNAGKLFGDERFFNLANEMNAWTASAQEEDGSWAQIYSTDGLQGRNSALGVPLFKNYIMLYTLRAHCDLYNQTGDKTALDQIVKFADYLLNQMGVNDWTYDPNNTEGKNMTGEDKSRGKAPIQEAMEAEIFLTVYNGNGEEKYFDGLCRVLSNYIATMLPTGFATQRYNHKDYLKGQINSVISGQNTTLMRIDNALCDLFTQNRELAKKLGYDGLVSIYADGASLKNEDIYHEFQNIELGCNLYESKDGRYIFVSNNSGYNSGLWEKDVKIHIAGKASLWTDFVCELSNTSETLITRNMNMFDSVYSQELPISVTTLDMPVTAEVLSYSEDKIVFTASADGGRANFEIADGRFSIDNNTGYSIIVSEDIVKKITITKGGNIYPTDGKLKINLDFSDDLNVFYDLINHWSYDEVMSLYKSGIVKGKDELSFAPNEDITLRHTLLLIMRSANINDEDAVIYALENGILLPGEETLLDLPATREQIINCTLRALSHFRHDDMSESDVDFSTYFVPKEISDDYAAVISDSEALSFESNELYDNITLPSGGIYGSRIEWSGGNEFLSPDGKITYPDAASPDAEATLTAKFIKGSASCTKEYNFTVKSASSFLYQSGSFMDSIIPISRQSGDFSFEFAAIPDGDNVNWCIGFFDENVMPQGYSDMALIVRFNPNGFIDAYNRTDYAALNKLRYKAGQKYIFKISGSVKTKTFSATVIDADGNTTEIAADYIFRSTSDISDNLGLMNSVVASGRGVITDLTIASPEPSGKPYGYVGGKEYFGITDSDVKLSDSGIKYFSSSPDVINNEGRFIKKSREDTFVYLIGLPDSAKLFDDFEAADPASYLNILNALSLGIIRQGTDNMLRPQDTCTRAEAACIAQRFYMLLKVKNLKWH